MNINIKFGIIKFTADYNSGTILDRTSWSVLRIPLCNSKDKKKNPLPCYNILLVSQFKQEDPLRSYSLVSAIVCWFVLIIVLKFVGNE